MKVFLIRAYGYHNEEGFYTPPAGQYFEGVALVAAEDEMQATRLATQIEDVSYGVYYGDPDPIEELPMSYEGPPHVFFHREWICG